MKKVITREFESILDVVQVICLNEQQWKNVRSKLLRGMNNILRELEREDGNN